MEQNYKVVNGTCYNENTPNDVIKILEKARKERTRVRLFFGDTFSGADWLEEYETIGYVGRSCGNCKIPILLSKENSSGGGAILTDCIVRITIDKKEAYRNKKYVLPKLKVLKNGENTQNDYPYVVFSEDKQNVVALCKSREKAERLAAFLRGERNCK